MRPTRRPLARCTQKGFSIVTAIFLLVILAGLGAFMITMSTSQNIASALDFQGSQAFRAARAGIEWGAASVKASATACYATNPTVLAVDGYTVTVTCTLNTYDEGGTNRYIFWLDSTANKGGAVGGIGYIERTVNAFVEF